MVTANDLTGEDGDEAEPEESADYWEGDGDGGEGEDGEGEPEGGASCGIEESHD